MKTLLISSVLGLASVALVSAAGDTQSVTLDHKLEIPGATLKSGQYTFSVEDRLQDRAIIRITDDKRNTHELLLAVPNEKLSGANQNKLILFPTSDPDKQILEGWMCPSCQSALELVYPKGEAVKITGVTAKPVMAVDPTSDKLPKNLTQDDMKVVTLWLLSPKEITADQKGKGVEAAKYADLHRSDLHTNDQKTVANAASAPAPAGGPVTDTQVAAASATPEAPAAPEPTPAHAEVAPAPAPAEPSPIAPAASAPVAAAPPASAVAAPAAVAPAPSEVASNTAPHRKMPHTASNTYAFGLSGLLLLAAGLSLRLSRRYQLSNSGR